MVSYPSGLFAGALGQGLGNNIPGVGNAQGPSFSGGGRLITVNPRGGFDGGFKIGRAHV